MKQSKEERLKPKRRKVLYFPNSTILERIIPIRMNDETWIQFGLIVDKLIKAGLISKNTSRTSIIRDLIEGWIVEESAFIARQEASNLIYTHAVQDFEGGSK